MKRIYFRQHHKMLIRICILRFTARLEGVNRWKVLNENGVISGDEEEEVQNWI